MSDKIYKINSPIKVVFQALGGQTGITDLSMVITDPSGNDSAPVVMTELSNGLYETSFTPDENGRWWAKITSVSNPENGSKTSYVVGYQEAIGEIILVDTNGAERDVSKDATSQEISDRIGSLSGTDVINELLKIYDKLNGVLEVTIPPSGTNQSIQLVWDKLHTAPNKFEWQEVLTYTVPTGFDLNAVAFDSKSNVANESARVVSKVIHGSFNSLTDTYTDSGFSWTEPKFGSKIYLLVTTATPIIGANDIVTITYTNSLGITGRTGTVTVPKNSVIGTRLEFSLQSGDLGVLDITNVTHSAIGQIGVYDIESIIELFYLTLTASAVQYQSSAVSLGGIVVLEGETIYLQYESNSAISNNRRLSLVATLVEKSDNA